MEVTRYDSGRLGKVERNGAGGIRVPGNIGRTGIQLYTNPDGSLRREYRPADAVFAEDSLKSLAGVPVTRLHPPGGRVDAVNWKQLARGHVGETSQKVPGASGDFISSSLLINDAELISEIDGGGISEISAGYTAHVEMTPGITPDGQPYDAIQSNVRYNHVAVGPPGWARAGREARLRIDGGEIPPNQKADVVEVKVVLDGVEYVKGSDSHVSALTKQAETAKAEALKTKTDSDAALAAAKSVSDTALATATARADKAEKELKDLKELHTDAAFEARMVTELAFRADAIKYLGKDFDFKGKSRRDVQVAVLKKIDPKVDIKADHSDEYVSVYFQGRLDGAPKPHDYNDGKPALEADKPHEASQAALNARLDGAFVPAGKVSK